jgi:integrase
MRKNFTQNYISSLKLSEDKPYIISDTTCGGLFVYVGNEKKVFYWKYIDKQKRQHKHKIGDTSGLTVAQAREMANDLRGRLARGENINPEKPKIVTLRGLLDVYEPIVTYENRCGPKDMKMIRSIFDFLLDKPVDSLTILELEKWRTERHDNGRGVKRATINRNTATLKSVLSWGVKRGVIERNPLEKLRPLPADDSTVIERYLSRDELRRLLTVLNGRDDYMRPLVLLALVSGARRAALFSLKWKDIDFDRKLVTLQPSSAKSKKIQRVPISGAVVKMLVEWRLKNADVTDDDLIFRSPRTGGRFDNVNKAWKSLMKDAEIERFRFHDCRHNAASQIINSTKDLNIVRALLGHSDARVTQRYAHLLPDKVREAAETLSDSILASGDETAASR